MLLILLLIAAALIFGLVQTIEALVALAIFLFIIWAIAGIIGAGFGWGFRSRR